MFYIPQTNQSNCGFTCVKMLLANLFHNKDFLYLEEKEQKEAYAFSDLIAIADEWGVTLSGFKMGNHRKEVLHFPDLPIILSVMPFKNVEHAILVYKIKGNYLYVLDPAKGKYKMHVNKLLNIWTGYGLYLESYDFEKSPKQIKHPLTFKDYFTNALMQIISSCALVAGVYFTSEEYSPLVSLIFFVLFAIFELTFRSGLLRLMRKIDEFYLNRVKTRKENYQTFYYKFIEYKKLVLINPMNLVFSLLTSCFIIFITMWNNPMNFLLVIFPLFLSLLDVFLFKKKDREDEMYIAYEERHFEDAKDLISFRNKVKYLQESSYDLTFNMTFRKVTSALLMCFAAAITMEFNHIIVIPYVIFYFAIQFALYENFNKIFSYTNKKHQAMKNECSMLNLINVNDEIDPE